MYHKLTIFLLVATSICSASQSEQKVKAAYSRGLTAWLTIHHKEALDDINAQDADGRTALMIAMANGQKVDPESTEGQLFLLLGMPSLLEHPDQWVEELIKLKANPNIQDKKGSTVLILAACNDHTGHIKMLLEAGANPNLSTKLGLTPLQASLQARNSATIKLLLKYGARGRSSLKNVSA